METLCHAAVFRDAAERSNAFEDFISPLANRAITRDSPPNYPDAFYSSSVDLSVDELKSGSLLEEVRPLL